MSGRGIRIPCCWDGCKKTIRSQDHLTEHVAHVHKVKSEHFGCRECGFITPDEHLMRNHSREQHAIEAAPSRAPMAFAWYCRREFIKADPSRRAIPANEYWRQAKRKRDDSSGRCYKCKAFITPWTQNIILQHLVRYHHVTVDLDSDDLHRRHRKYVFESYLSDGIDLVDNNELGGAPGDENDSESEYWRKDFNINRPSDDPDDLDVENSSDSDDDDDDDSTGLVDCRQACTKQTSVTAASAQLHDSTTQSIPICVTDSYDIKSILASCAKDEQKPYIRQCFASYRIQSHKGTNYLVGLDLPDTVELNSGKVACAAHGPSGWHCQVLHCCAILRDEDVMKLHLQAHGSMTKWWCGDVSCRATNEKSFEDYLELDKHIVCVHGNCAYSRLAARPVPMAEVLAVHLEGILELKCVSVGGPNDEEDAAAYHENRPCSTRSIADDEFEQLCGQLVSGSIEMILMHELRLAVSQMNDHAQIPAWEKYLAKKLGRGLSGTDDLFVRRSDFDKVFDEYCDGQYVYIPRQPRVKKLRPVIWTNKYCVETLIGFSYMDKKHAEILALSYHSLCESISTELADEFLRCLKSQARSHEIEHEEEEEEEEEEGKEEEREAEEQKEEEREEEREEEKEEERDGDDEEEEEEEEERAIDHDKESHLNRHVYGEVPDRRFFCPWPNCDHDLSAVRNICDHFVNVHLNCVWQCPETGCEYCGYRNFHLLERHRLLCHIGSSLSCGHESCERVHMEGPLSKGHTSWSRLRRHYEYVFNQELGDSGSNAIMRQSTRRHETHEQMLRQADYQERFSGKSADFLGRTRCEERRRVNLGVLQGKYGVDPSKIHIQGSKYCSGFSLDHGHFTCADLVSLTLDTAVLIFVPVFMVFTVAPTCDYCIHTMSQMYRPKAELPSPFHFVPRDLKHVRKRVGIGSHITDHASFHDFASTHRLQLPPMAVMYKTERKDPRKIFIVDFETVRRSEKGQPLWPTEITARHGDGKVIVSCVINHPNVTNSEFEKQLKQAGFTDRQTLGGVRRIRGAPGNIVPPNSETPQQILHKLLRAGLSSKAFWVEYSITSFDRRCMVKLIEMAGRCDAEMILPPPSRCWTVIADFWRSIPGLSSYRLGRIMQLMQPKHPSLKKLHHSEADTALLYDLLRLWIDTYGLQVA